MGKFGETAVLAAELMRKHANKIGSDAWEVAVARKFPKSPSARAKSCPRGAFLGLCAAGLIRSIPSELSAKFTSTSGTYAVEAVGMLREDESLAAKGPKELWMLTSGADKVQNHQMDVVLTLWRHGLIRSSVDQSESLTP